MEPIIEFKNIIDARTALKEWQHRLYLDDWIISLRLVDGTEIPGLSGRSEADHVNRCAVIKLSRITEDISSRIMKVAQEEVLVHELLHLKQPIIDNETYESTYHEVKQHGMLEQMSRSLIMAKYGVGPEWFINTDVD